MKRSRSHGVNLLTDRKIYQAMRLADRAARAAAKAANPDAAFKALKPRKLSDGGGLYIEVTKQGRALVRQKYFFNKREALAAHGKYPAVSLEMARDRRTEIQRLIAAGVNPAAHKRAAKLEQQLGAENTFSLWAQEYLKKKSGIWCAKHAKKCRDRITKDLLPLLGRETMATLQDNAPLVLRAIERIEARQAGDTARRALNDVGSIFELAIAKGAAKRDPTVGLVKALAPIVEGHFAAIIDPQELGGLIRAIRGYRCKGQPVVRAALELLALTFTRPGEMRLAEWSEFDLYAAMWRIPAARTKMRREHLVPLSPQAVTILRELEPGHGRLVFPSIRSSARPISDNTLVAALRRMGYTSNQMCAHGFRSTASTLLAEMGWDSSVVEAQLAHKKAGVAGVYDRSTLLPKRTAMMAAWANFLDELAVKNERQVLAA